MTAVRSSGVSIPAILSHPLRLLGAVPGSTMAFQVKAMSFEVIGCPSDQKIQDLSFHVTVRPSADTPPLSALGISVAKYGTRLFLSSHRPGPAPTICHIHAAKLMVLKSPTASSGSCSNAIVM